MHLTIVSGTNRADNLTVKVSSICQAYLASLGIEADLMDLRLLPREIAFGYLDAGGMDAFREYQALVDQTSHFIFVAPEYNGSIPGILKVFIDACDYPGSFRGKTAAMVGIAAGSGGNERGLAHLQDVLSYFGMHVHPEKVTVPRIREKLLPEGGFRDEIAAEALQAMLAGFVAGPARK